jgi:hypothetical protein
MAVDFEKSWSSLPLEEGAANLLTLESLEQLTFDQLNLEHAATTVFDNWITRFVKQNREYQKNAPPFFDAGFFAAFPTKGEGKDLGRRNFKDTNPYMSSLLVIYLWGGEAIL